MPPSGLAIVIGAGPSTGRGIAKVLSSPSHGNLAVALLARSPGTLSSTRENILSTSPKSVIETFLTDTSPENLTRTFFEIRRHPSFGNLKLSVAVYNIKHSSKKPFMTETHADFSQSLETYVGGAMAFAQESLKLLFEHHGEEDLTATNGAKKGTLIFTGTLGALRASSQFGAYGAGRAGVRQLAQSLAREFSPKGVHVVHTIANGVIADEHGEAQTTGKSMSAEAVGKTYLFLAQQSPELWTHELDMRPAQEKF